MLDLSRDQPFDARPRPVRASGRSLRILFTGYRSHPHVGGQGVYLAEVTRALAELGHHVDVVSGPPYPELDPRVRLHRLASLDLFAAPNALMAFRPSFLFDTAHLSEWALHNTGAFGEPYAFALRLARWLSSRHGQFDVIHDNQGLAGPMRRASEVAGAPLAATLHHPVTVDLEHALAFETSALRRQMLRRWHGFARAQARVARTLPAILTVSEASKRRAARDFDIDPARIVVAPIGVDHDAFQPNLDIRRDPGHVVAVASSDTPIKGMDVLLAAFSRLAATRPSARLTIVGRLRDDSMRAWRAGESGGTVRFVSGLSKPEMARLYSRAGVVVAPARFEGFGLPAAEAMACAAPVVATDGGALPEVVGDAGRVTPAGDVAALSEAIGAMLDDPEAARALGRRAALRAREAFRWDRHAQAALELYERIGVC